MVFFWVPFARLKSAVTMATGIRKLEKKRIFSKILLFYIVLKDWFGFFVLIAYQPSQVN